jgi:VWFA-related protein
VTATPTPTPRLAAALVAFVIATAAVTAGQVATFRARMDAVRVDVLVTDRGRTVANLSAGDFEVRDNGVPQQVDLVSFQRLPLNVVLAVDASSSVSGERLEHLRAASLALLGGLTKEDRAALITFSHVVALRQALTADVEQVRTALAQIASGGETALVDGSHAAMLLGEAEAGRTLVLIFSDGFDTASWLPAERVLATARRSEVVVYGVAVRGPEKPQFLRDLGDLTGGGVVEVESTKDLATSFVRILDEFRQRYLVSYSPRDVPDTGWHRLDVRVKGRSLTVKARSGYQAGPGH